MFPSLLLKYIDTFNYYAFSGNKMNEFLSSFLHLKFIYLFAVNKML